VCVLVSLSTKGGRIRVESLLEPHVSAAVHAPGDDVAAFGVAASTFVAHNAHQSSINKLFQPFNKSGPSS